jgi:hypothetical protein
MGLLPLSLSSPEYAQQDGEQEQGLSRDDYVDVHVSSFRDVPVELTIDTT